MFEWIQHNVQHLVFINSCYQKYREQSVKASKIVKRKLKICVYHFYTVTPSGKRLKDSKSGTKIEMKRETGKQRNTLGLFTKHFTTHQTDVTLLCMNDQTVKIFDLTKMLHSMSETICTERPIFWLNIAELVIAFCSCPIIQGKNVSMGQH